MKSNSQSAFTLVELAIVLMIIGLLIGGILKGQELINNARVTSTIRQVKSYDAAVTTFRDAYNAWPGDMLTPATRLADCGTAPCNTAGNNNGRIDGPNIEVLNFWRHLAKANMVSGIDATSTAPSPRALVGEGIIYAAPYNNGVDQNKPSFHINANDANLSNGDVALSGRQAAMIDRKMDDGKPLTGSVIGSDDPGGSWPELCLSGTNYLEGNVIACSFYIHMQQ